MKDKHIPLDYTDPYWKKNNPAAYGLAVRVKELEADLNAFQKYGCYVADGTGYVCLVATENTKLRDAKAYLRRVIATINNHCCRDDKDAISKILFATQKALADTQPKPKSEVTK